MRENFIGNFLDELDINTKAYYVLLTILAILIALTLYVNYSIRSERDVIVIDKPDTTILYFN